MTPTTAFDDAIAFAQAHDAVVVARWLDPAYTGGFTQRVGEALCRT